MAVASASTTAPARPLLPVTRPELPSPPLLDRRAISARGWAYARTMAHHRGGEVRDYLAEGMRSAWSAAKRAAGLLGPSRLAVALEKVQARIDLDARHDGAGAVPSNDTLDAVRTDVDALVVARGHMPTADSPCRVASDRPAPIRSVDQVEISDVVPSYPDAAGIDDAPHRGARCADIVPPLARHGNTLTTLARSGEQMPPAAVFDLDELDTAAEARTLHLRRQLEAAAEHGADLLAALGWPRLVGPDFVALDPVTIGDEVDRAIAALDALDGDTDLEDGADDEFTGDDELSLGWTAKVDQVHLGYDQDDHEVTALERHGLGFFRSGPDDAEEDDPAEHDFRSHGPASTLRPLVAHA